MLNLKKTVKALVLSSIAFLGSCSSDDTESNNQFKVTTNEPIITGTQGTFGGNVVSDGGNSVTDRGVVIGPNTNPVITDETNNFVGHIGSGTGTFSETYDLSSAPPGVYYYRAFAVNTTGVVYGEEKIINYGISTSCNQVIVNSNITTPTTWITGNVYMVENWINVNAPLVIQPGVIIKFKNGNAGMEVYAKITADATVANPIIFTSYKDDSYCGDSNNDGTASTPAKGDWGRLTMRGDQHGSVFKYCKFLWGGASNNGVVQMDSGTGNIHDFTFDHCTFAHTSGTINHGSAAFSGVEMYDESISVVTNNVFYDNAIPIYIRAKYGLSSSNIYHNPDNASEINKYNGIFVFGGGMAGRSVVYGETEVPYVFNVSGNAILSVGSSGFLKIEPSVIIKFGQPDSQFDLGDYPNNANVDGTVVFTSYRDDIHGGDTNGDGSTSSPATGDWNGYGYWTTGHNNYIWVQNNVFYAAH